jgi:hypothetical protein
MYIGAAHRAARRPQFAGRSSQLAGRRPHVGARAWRARPGICAIPRSFRWGNHTNSQRVAHVANVSKFRKTNKRPSRICGGFFVYDLSGGLHSSRT